MEDEGPVVQTATGHQVTTETLRDGDASMNLTGEPPSYDQVIMVLTYALQTHLVLCFYRC